MKIITAVKTTCGYIMLLGMFGFVSVGAIGIWAIPFILSLDPCHLERWVAWFIGSFIWVTIMIKICSDENDHGI